MERGLDFCVQPFSCIVGSRPEGIDDISEDCAKVNIAKSRPPRPGFDLGDAQQRAKNGENLVDLSNRMFYGNVVIFD